MCIEVAIAIIISKILSQILDTIQITLYKIVAHINEIETIFARLGIDLFSLKSRMYLPITLQEISLLYSFCELRTYRAAARRRSGVVGNSGRKMPIIPNPNDRVPKTMYKYFNNCIVQK